MKKRSGPTLLDLTEFFSEKGGGVRTYLEQKAAWLSTNTDWNHVIVVPGPRDSVEEWHGAALHRIRGPKAPASPGYHVFKDPGRIRSLFEDIRPDLVEVGSIYLAPWLARYAADGLSLPVVAYYHMDLPSVVRQTLENSVPGLVLGPLTRMTQAYTRAAYANCAAIAAASPSAAKTLKELGLPDVRQVPLGVDSELFNPKLKNGAWRAELGINRDKKIALYAGRLSGEKGVRVILDALPGLSEGAGIHVIMIGDGHMKDELETYSKGHPDRLTVLPFESDRNRLAAIYASADMYISPFPNETFGLSTIEAMASGLPVAGVDAGGVRDLIDGQPWARSYRVGDHDGLVGAALDLVACDLNVLGAEARTSAVSRFGWDSTWTDMLNLYEGVLARR